MYLLDISHPNSQFPPKFFSFLVFFFALLWVFHLQLPPPRGYYNCTARYISICQELLAFLLKSHQSVTRFILRTRQTVTETTTKVSFRVFWQRTKNAIYNCWLRFSFFLTIYLSVYVINTSTFDHLTNLSGLDYTRVLTILSRSFSTTQDVILQILGWQGSQKYVPMFFGFFAIFFFFLHLFTHYCGVGNFLPPSLKYHLSSTNAI